MKQHIISGQSGNSQILVGERIENVGNFLPEGRIVIITDINVFNIYKGKFPACPVVTIGTGEKIKTVDTVSYIFSEFLKLGVDRSWFVLGIGGGVVSDLAGFAASTFMRGLPFGFVSTTLLSQVDASVGGKNGINFSGFKNIVGTFSQPAFVLLDFNLLKTLDRRELKSGLAEIIKHAIISGEEMFRFLEDNYQKALSLDLNVIERLVNDSVVLKAKVVNCDEKEKGHRRVLNLGHTFGHAIEAGSGYNHGESVAAGMAMSCGLSVANGVLDQSVSDRIVSLIKQCGLPVSHSVSSGDLKAAILNDKKKSDSLINYVYIRKIGEVFVSGTSIDDLFI